MNTAYQNLIERRSVKNFKSDPVPQELVDKIIKAGLNAPSAMNHQGTIVIQIKDKNLRDEMSRDNAIIGTRNGDPFYNAPVVLLVLGDKSWVNRIYDGALVLGNMLNAAHSLGLGSCWIHRCREEFEMPKYQELLKKLGISGEYEGIGHCVIGYPNVQPPTSHDLKEQVRVFSI